MPPSIRTRKRNFQFTIGKDRAILMICIGIALVFWLLVKLSQNYSSERELSFNLTIPDDKTFSKAPPDDIRVEINGTGWDLLFDYFSKPEIILPLNLEQNDQLTLSNSRLRTAVAQQLSARGLSVSSVDVDNVTLRLEPKESKRVPVKLKGSFSFAPEYHLRGPVLIRPDSISVTGPASLITDLREWATDSLVLTELKSDQTREIILQKPPPELKIGTSKVEVVIELEQYTEKSLFVELELKNEPPNDSLRYFPQRIKVTCIVGLSQYDEVKPENFRLVADLQGTPVGKERNRVAIELKERPAFVKNVNFSPKTAEFFIVQKEEDLPDNPN